MYGPFFVHNYNHFWDRKHSVMRVTMYGHPFNQFLDVVNVRSYSVVEYQEVPY